MGFDNPIVGGISLRIPAIQSPNFSDSSDTGVTGWKIAIDGSAFFYNLTIGSDNYFVDANGNAVFQTVTANDSITLAGNDLQGLLDAKPNGLLYWGSRTSNSDSTSGSTEVAVLTLGTTLVDQRMYRLATSEMRVAGTNTGDVFKVHVRDGGSSAPTTSSNLITLSSTAIDSGSTEGQTVGASITFTCDNSSSVAIDNFHSGTHNFLLAIVRDSGTGTAYLSTGTNTTNPIQLYLEDLGPLIQNTGANQSGGGGGNPTTQYTTTYSCNASATYQQGGGNRSLSQCYQGYYSGTNGNQWSLIGFPYTTIASDLSGATDGYDTQMPRAEPSAKPRQPPMPPETFGVENASSDASITTVRSVGEPSLISTSAGSRTLLILQPQLPIAVNSPPLVSSAETSVKPSGKASSAVVA